MTQLIQFSSSIALSSQVLIFAKDTNLPANRLRGALVVARDAYDADARRLALRDRVAHLGARRVEHADERNEDEVLLEVAHAVRAVPRRVEREVRGVRERERVHTTVAKDGVLVTRIS